MNSGKTIYDLELHEEIEINDRLNVFRVNGGWIYKSYSIVNGGITFRSSVFVPYSDEFKPFKGEKVQITELSENMYNIMQANEKKRNDGSNQFP